MTEKRKILIADDEPANLFNLELILKETEAELVRAGKGNEPKVHGEQSDFSTAIQELRTEIDKRRHVEKKIKRPKKSGRKSSRPLSI